MTTADEVLPGADAPAKPRRRAAGGYLFIPKALQTPTIILWLRRTHAWTGYFGAIFFFFLGLSAIYLNHRAVMQLPQGAPREVASLDVPVDPALIASQADLVAWMQSEFKIDSEPAQQRGGPGGGQGGGQGGGGRPGGPVTFNGQPATQPAEFTASFRGPNATITGTYQQGANMAHVTRTNSGFVRMIIDLHKVVGVSAGFILMMDAIAGAMMFMSLSGVVLWTRLHGPRVGGVGIMLAVIGAAAILLSGTWVGWAAP